MQKKTILWTKKLKKWKKANGFDTEEELTIAEIAVRQAQALAGAISSSGGSPTPTSTPKDPNDITD